MANSKWETVAHIAGVLALIISGLNLYYNHFNGPELSIQSFPLTDFGVRQDDINKDISFTFQIHNDGGKTAFIRNIFVLQITGSKKELIYSGAYTEPNENFYIDSSKTEVIKVILPASKVKIINEMKIQIWYEPGLERLESEVIPVSWN